MGTVFSSRMRELRTVNGMSQKRLGKFLGLSDKTVSAYENGRNTPDLEILVRLSEVFGVTVDYLLGVASAEKTLQRTGPLDDVPIYDAGDLVSPVEHAMFPSSFGYSCGIKVYDDSVEPIFFMNDVVLVRRGPALEGDLVVWNSGGSVIFRRFYFHGESIILKPENSKYRPVVLEASKMPGSLFGVIAGRWQRFG